MDSGFLSEAFVSFQGEGAEVGRRHLFVRFAGCPLRCRYCDTPASLVPTKSFVAHAAGYEETLDNPLSPAALLESVGKLLSSQGSTVDGTAFTGGEPLSQAPFLAALLGSGDLPRPYLLESSGTQPEALSRVLPIVDIVSMDIKLPSNSGETAFWDVHERFLEMSADKVYVKMLVDDGTAFDDVERASRMVAAAGPDIAVYLQPISSPNQMVVIDPVRLGGFFRTAREWVKEVRVVPQIHKMLGLP